MAHKVKLLVANLVLFLGLSSCLTDQDLSNDVKLKESLAKIEKYISSQNIKATKLPDGSYYFVGNANSAGRKIADYDSVFVNFVLTDLDGKLVDSSQKSKPFSFVNYKSYVGNSPIFNQLLSVLKEGETGTIIIPGYPQSFSNLDYYEPIRCDVTKLKIRNQDDLIDEYIAKKKLIVTEKTSTGLRYILVSSGSGEQASDSKTVKVKYAGKLLNDIAFDSNFNSTDSLSVNLASTTSVIKGFREGLLKMRVGERAYLIFPSTLGYGVQGSGKIPPLSPLFFEIKLAAAKAN